MAQILFVDSQLSLIIGVWLGDEGLYICEAKNPYGTIKTGARVTVTGLGMLLLTSSIRNLCDPTTTGFLRLAHIPGHRVFMGSHTRLQLKLKVVVRYFLNMTISFPLSLLLSLVGVQKLIYGYSIRFSHKY